MTEWAAKVLEGVPRIIPPQAWVSGQDFHYAIMEADALAAIAKLVEGDDARLIADCELAAKVLADTGTFETGQSILREAAAHIVALTAQNREMALDVLASSGQAQEAYAAQLAAEAEAAALRAKVARLEGAGDISEDEDDKYLIRKRGMYYRPNSEGYTSSRAEAGRYTLAQAVFITHPNGPDGPRDSMSFVPVAARTDGAADE